MEKKKMSKALMITAALAGGMALTQSFFNEAQASGGGIRSCQNRPRENNGDCETKDQTNGTYYYVCEDSWFWHDCVIGG